jgi:hypothetical protein
MGFSILPAMDCMVMVAPWVLDLVRSGSITTLARCMYVILP